MNAPGDTLHSHTHHNAAMLSVEEALERVLGVVKVLEAEEKPVLEAVGQVLAEDVVSHLDIPPLENSAMDGFAARSRDIAGASPDSPVILKVVGGVKAGGLPDRDVQRGDAVRIMTGAPVPPGADTVVPFEGTDEIARRESADDLEHIGVHWDTPLRANVRPAGQDLKKGDKALARGTVLRPAEIGVLASLGRATARVIRRPVVAVLATGDELVSLGDVFGPGNVYNSNSYGIAAGVMRYGGIPRMLGIARDNLESIRGKLTAALDSDLLVTSAGVSKGDYDVVKDVLVQHGKIDFWSVRMRPAKPLAFGVLTAPDGREVPHLGLPGNPVSAMVAFEQFGRVALYKMMGKTNYEKPIIKAVLDEPIHNSDGRRVYARAIVTRRDGEYHARLTGHQSSNLLTSMARANGLAICPEDLPKKDVGEIVDVQMLDWPEDVF